MAYYFADHTDPRVSELNALMLSGGTTRFSRAYEDVGSFEMCRAIFGQGVTHVDKFPFLSARGASDELLSVRSMPLGGGSSRLGSIIPGGS